MPTIRTILAGASCLGLLAAPAAKAVNLQFMCYQDGNECQVLSEVVKGFEAKHSDITVNVDTVPYKAILETLPVQLAAGKGPDLARVTDLGGLHKYYLDLRPYVNGAYWQRAFGKTLDWYRDGKNDHGIYGMMTQMSISGGFVNKTLFDQAGIPLPSKGATWDDWAKAARAVAKATHTKFPMAMDRSGARFAGLSIPYGAKYFNASGKPELDDPGFVAAVKQFVAWNNDGTMDKNVWAAQGGATYAAANQEFVNGDLVFYYSGSWQIQKFASQIGDAFDWEVVAPPAGPAGPGSGMPGGAGFVGFKSTQHPKEVAELLNYLAQPGPYAEFVSKSLNISANAQVPAANVTYPDATGPAAKALASFSAQVPSLSPVAYAFQGYRDNRAMFNITVSRLTQAIVGEITIPEAISRITGDLKQAVSADQ